MNKEEMLAKVKENLKIDDDAKDLIILDTIQDALNYCNLKELPEEAEIYIRKKAKSIIDYEAEQESGAASEIKSISEGDTSITYNVGIKSSKESIYGLFKEDKRALSQFRRLRK